MNCTECRRRLVEDWRETIGNWDGVSEYCAFCFVGALKRAFQEDLRDKEDAERACSFAEDEAAELEEHVSKLKRELRELKEKVQSALTS